MEEWEIFVGVVVHPLAHVVGDVKSAVVVATELVVDEHELVVVVLEALLAVADQDVPALNVVVAEHHGRMDAR